MDEQNPFWNDGLLAFQIHTGDSLFQPVLEGIPAQILAYKLTQAQGLQPGNVRYISKVITMETWKPVFRVIIDKLGRWKNASVKFSSEIIKCHRKQGRGSRALQFYEFFDLTWET